MDLELSEMKNAEVEMMQMREYKASYLKKLSTRSTRTIKPYVYDFIPVSMVIDVVKS